MKNVCDSAFEECVGELRAACRRPIDETALDTMLGWLRPNFDRILNRVDGGKRWAEHGQRLRETSRHLGALADFFSGHEGASVVGLQSLTHALAMIRADCTTKALRTPLAFQYCKPAPVDCTAAEAFLSTITPAPELERRAS